MPAGSPAEGGDSASPLTHTALQRLGKAPQNTLACADQDAAGKKPGT